MAGPLPGNHDHVQEEWNTGHEWGARTFVVVCQCTVCMHYAHVPQAILERKLFQRHATA